MVQSKLMTKAQLKKVLNLEYCEMGAFGVFVSVDDHKRLVKE